MGVTSDILFHAAIPPVGFWKPSVSQDGVAALSFNHVLNEIDSGTPTVMFVGDL